MIDWAKEVLAPVMGQFGEPVQFRPLRGKPFTITGVFDEAYTLVELGGETGISSTMPVLGVQLSDFRSHELPLQKDRVVITRNALHAGGIYVIKEVRPDGHGGAKLLLNYLEG